jgi:hypothetical protein
MANPFRPPFAVAKRDSKTLAMVDVSQCNMLQPTGREKHLASRNACE